MIAIKKGTTNWRQVSVFAADEVEFIGDFSFDADGFTPLMVWDETLQNCRPMNASELAARAVFKSADDADAVSWAADKATLKAAVADASTRLAQIRDAASPTNAQVIQAVRDIAGYQLQIIKVLRRML